MTKLERSLNMRLVCLIIAIVTVSILVSPTVAAQIYVKADATGANDGTSWTDAYTDLQDARAAAISGDEIWVAAGTYYPTSGVDRFATFQLKNGVAIYGGFAGTETSIIERDFVTSVTILSGDIGVPGDSTDNSLHVVSGFANTATAILDGFTVTQGNADLVTHWRGGGIKIDSSPTLANLIVFRNSCGYQLVTQTGTTTKPGKGGGLHNLNGFPTLNNVHFRKNTARWPNSRGGGMVSENGNVQLTNVSFTANVAVQYGGGASLEGGNIVIRNALFTDNTAGAGTGLSSWYSGGTDIDIRDAVFEYNNGYGALWVGSSGSMVTMNRVDIRFNNGTGMGLGNPLHADIDSCTFEGNSGGGIRSGFGATVTITNSSFINNTALESGGAITWADADVDNCLFVGNTAPSAGGAIAGWGSVTNSTFTGNSAGKWGGAMNLDGSVSNCVFRNNSATLHGGAIYGSGKLTNVLFVNNSATMGGAIYAVDDTLVVTNSTIVNNEADGTGGGISAFDQLVLTNSIVWNNTASDDIEVANNGILPAIDHSLVAGSGGSGPGWDPTIGTDGGGNVDSAPLFGGPPGEELRLSWSSPCVNGGDNAAPELLPTDFAGNPRIEDGVVDMGAYEFKCAPGPVAYFDADATGTDDGSSWDDAYRVFRMGSTTACSGITELWVAEGTYTPTDLDDRSATFHLANGIAAYGGFAGDETSRSQRRPGDHPTILSGEIGNPPIGDNALHVVTGTDTDSTAILDGFVVSGGFASDLYPDDRGAGMVNFPGSPTVVNTVFQTNTAVGGGGGMYNHIGSSPILSNVVFDGNAASLTDGGGMYNLLSDLTLTNVTFSNNSGFGAGGAMFNNGGNIVLTNVVAWGNQPSVNQIFNLSGSPLVGHSLVEGCGGSGLSWNPSVGTDAGGNLDEDPLFVDGAGGDYHLSEGSPAIDVGDNSAPHLPDTDIDGNSRIVGVAVDMGAYEHFVATAVESSPAPAASALGAPYPNPFNPTVTIVYQIETGQRVTLEIYDVGGRLVRSLVDEVRNSGVHESVWDGTDRTGARAASGVYLVKLVAGTTVDNRKITLLK
jgi:predicted outer membrane repeat protein